MRVSCRKTYSAILDGGPTLSMEAADTQPSAASDSMSNSPPILRIPILLPSTPLLFEPHAVADGDHAADVAGHIERRSDVCQRTDEAAQLDDAFEGFDVDFSGFQAGLVEYRRLYLGGDDRIVDVFPGSFVCSRGGAAHNGRHRQGEKKRRNALERFHIRTPGG